ncbi:MAG: PocR ligand-binding domain-containing protein [Verrucomicrobia bacterium]|nr:PocR ligand-binding domain-containing protein [Verrucomicrobiota bacterium]
MLRDVNDKANRHLLEQLSKSRMFQDYERAFSAATGMPLTLRPAEVWQVAHHGKKDQNPFCALMAKTSRTCAACLEVQQKISQQADDDSCSATCFAGMCDTAVPIRLGKELVGYLQTGQVFTRKPTKAMFDRTTRQLVQWGLKTDFKQMEEAYFHTRIISPKQYEAMVRLLTIFGQHLSVISNQLAVQEANAEPPVIARAKQFIHDHQTEELSLGLVSKAVNTSSFYFCKLFKKATGINFTEYVSRVRVEKAKNLLLNPNLRISEIAYEVGFQSLTHFNRIFRKLTGQSPTDYREKLPKFDAVKRN